MNDQDVWIVLTTVPDAETGSRIAVRLVEERLAACVNRIPGVVSHYRWEGRLCVDAEEVLLMKTTAGRFSALRTRLLELHPYETPACTAIPAAAGAGAYEAWLRAAVGG